MARKQLEEGKKQVEERKQVTLPCEQLSEVDPKEKDIDKEKQVKIAERLTISMKRKIDSPERGGHLCQLSLFPRWE